MRRMLVIGWLLGVLTLGVGAVVGSNWYEYRMLSPADCARFEVAQLDIGNWYIAPNQPNGCYLRRARLRIL